MDKTFLIAQAIGMIGVLLFVLSFQIKSSRKLFITQIMSNTMFAIQFLILGAYAGCVNLIICILRNFCMMNKEKWRFIESKWALLVMIGLFFANTVINWHAWYDIFSFAAAGSATVGVWTGNPRNIRTSNLFVASPCWIIYDICVGSLTGIANEVIAMVSIIISIIRFGWKNLGENGEEFK